MYFFLDKTKMHCVSVEIIEYVAIDYILIITYNTKFH